ncbi:MAG TPA: acyl carrier protein [Blastocatellia bacterium]|jgi:acyl carrier protein|nr:acyl carrier protein [Blastocatellia bacterium]
MIDRESVKESMAAFLKQPASKLSDDLLLADLVTESFALVEMVIELQEEFRVRFIQEDLKNVRTVGDLTGLFESRGRE